ncbi:hypothetical protein JXA80_12045 [bacterium]|nr:hypothetical protein [candidate division CSSED10-310 bacterium]
MTILRVPDSLPSSTSRDFIDAYRYFGRKSVDGSNKTYWLQHGRWALMRFPAFCRDVPEKAEINRILHVSAMPVISYIRPAFGNEKHNSYLYIRSGPYSASELDKKPRQSINRANKFLTIRFLSWDELRTHGAPVFIETRTRVGLSDGVTDTFNREIDFFSHVPGHTAWGAWKDDRLVAFMIGAEVDDYYTLSLACSTNDSLTWCPNNALFDAVFDLYLNQRKCRLVSAGLSSLQQGTEWENLHNFKLRVGFEALEVKRCFAVNRWFKPFLNRFVYRGMLGLQSVFPRHPLIRKGVGVFEILLGNDRKMEDSQE